MKFEIRKRGTPAAQTRGVARPHEDAVFVPLKSSPNGGGRWEIDADPGELAVRFPHHRMLDPIRCVRDPHLPLIEVD